MIKTGLSPPVKYFTDRSKAILLLGIILFYLCLVFVIVSRMFNAALRSPAGKGLTSWLSFVCLIAFLLLSHVVSWVKCGT